MNTNISNIHCTECTTHAHWQAARHFRDTYFFGPHGIEDPYTWTFDHKDHKHFVCSLEDQIVGYAHIQLWPQNRCAIRIIAIDEQQRSLGLGSQFLQGCEAWLKEHGYKSIHTESRQASVVFYRRNGYIDMPFDDPDGYESCPEDVPLGKGL